MSLLRVSLLTVGDPSQITGGYLYHARMAVLAGDHDVAVSFVSPPSSQPQAFIVCARMLPTLDFDCLIVDSLAAYLLAPCLPLVRGAAMIASIHQPPGGFDGPAALRRARAHMDRMVYRRCRRLIVARQPLASAFRAQGFSEAAIVVVPPGRDVGPVSVEPGKDLRGGRRVACLCVANWLPNKGIDLLLRAVALVPDEITTLHLVGRDDCDAKYSTVLRRMIVELGLTSRVVVHGALPPGDVATLYRTADLFVLPSLNEAFATAAGEAMAAGLPVIAFNTGNLPNLVTKSDGILVALGDVGALARAIARLAQGGQDRLAMARSAAEHASSRPTWAESANTYFSVVREACDRPVDQTR